MMDHGKLAEENFRKGYNCAQSVLLAFGDVTGLDDRTAAMLTSSFGGGLGRRQKRRIITACRNSRGASGKRTARSSAANYYPAFRPSRATTPNRERTRITKSAHVPRCAAVPPRYWTKCYNSINDKDRSMIERSFVKKELSRIVGVFC